MCSDARSCVRPVKGYSINTLASTLVLLYYNGRSAERPYKGLLVIFRDCREKKKSPRSDRET